MDSKVVVDGLRLFSLEDVGERTGLGRTVLRDLAADPACPLKFVAPRHGRSKVCTAQVLDAFIQWLVTEPAIKAPE